MKRMRPEPERVVLYSAPEARRILAGDAITGDSRVWDSSPEEMQDLDACLALLPGLEDYATTAPAVSLLANLCRASGAEESGGAQ
jgi:hypothetical protein